MYFEDLDGMGQALFFSEKNSNVILCLHLSNYQKLIWDVRDPKKYERFLGIWHDMEYKMIR